MLNIGNRKQVMNNIATKTSGKLEKNDLIYNKNGKIVSKLKSNIAKKKLY